jgi:CheY-like chemotaxis protein
MIQLQQQYRFLYVEDDPLSCEIMTLLMEMGLGINTLTIFQDSEDFIERVKALPQRPDVFLIDIQVKPHNGFEMLRMLQADPDYRSVQVIALTASVMNEEVEKLRVSGFSGAIAKPLSIQTFPSLLKRILDGESIWHVA